MSQKMKR